MYKATIAIAGGALDILFSILYSSSILVGRLLLFRYLTLYIIPLHCRNMVFEPLQYMPLELLTVPTYTFYSLHYLTLQAIPRKTISNLLYRKVMISAGTLTVQKLYLYVSNRLYVHFTTIFTFYTIPCKPYSQSVFVI